MGRQVLAWGMWLRLGKLRSKVFVCGRWVVGLSLRWHSRCAFVAYALPFGRFAFALASALCLRASSVAPVRGGTYFSLPPQRKVGKRKRLTPPVPVFA
jgi:hypothetical protein